MSESPDLVKKQTYMMDDTGEVVLHETDRSFVDKLSLEERKINDLETEPKMEELLKGKDYTQMRPGLTHANSDKIKAEDFKFGEIKKNELWNSEVELAGMNRE